MKINYEKILQKNMFNVLKDVLHEIEINGLKEGHHLYITFKTINKDVALPNWLKKKFPKKMTIVIQYEYWDLKVFKEKFNISLAFNDIKAVLSIPYSSVLSFADPFANFGLKLSDSKKIKKGGNKDNKKDNILEKKGKIIDFNKF